MKLDYDCIVCMQRQVLRMTRMCTSDEKLCEEALREAMKVLLESKWDSPPTILAHKVHVKVRRILGVRDPYREVKVESNKLALNLYGKANEIISTSRDRLEAAVKVAIAGNVMDFAALENPDLASTLEKVVDQGFAVNDYSIFRDRVLKAKNLLFFADNAGEIVFDKILLETMIEVRGSPFEEVTFVVKGGPIVNDATVEDVKFVKLEEIPNLRVRTVSNGEPGTGPDRRSKEVLEWMKAHDLVISKGQGNYEAFSDYNGIFFILMVKCPVVARDLKAEIGDLILKYGG